MARKSRIFVYDKKAGEVVEVTREEVRVDMLPRWPMRSIRGGVHPSQVEEENAKLRAKGITDSRFIPGTGDAEWDNHVARKKFLRATDQRDFSGYG